MRRKFSRTDAVLLNAAQTTDEFATFFFFSLNVKENNKQ